MIAEKTRFGLLIAVLPLLILLLIACQPSPPSTTTKPEVPLPPALPTTKVKVIKDVGYGQGGDEVLKLDIYLPEVPAATPMPAVIWIHGGGWQGGDKYPGRIRLLAERGFFGASINYRLSDIAPFPAAVEDCKLAVRWLRANAEKYNVDPERIGVWGGSAGGHLVMMVGSADETAGLEGKGGLAKFSSRVQAVCAYYGPSDFNAIGSPRSNSAHVKFLGGTIEEIPDIYTLASPVTYVTPDDPPLLLVHGDLDRTVPFNQSEIMLKAYQQAGIEATLIKVSGAGHGFKPAAEGPVSHSNEKIGQIVLDFFVRHLLGSE
ncbi:prolyl oligopeptidase family serine peptidase [Chloroflexota bacterium]